MLEGQAALVTGAAQGIGAGIARVLAAKGARVCIVDIQAAEAAKLAEEIGGHAVEADLTTKEGCERAVAGTVAAFGRLDIIVNNAAPARNRALIGEIAGSDWEPHASLVLQAAAHLVDAARPHLKAGASVVNISSVTAHSIGVDQCSWPYHVSKAGLNQLTRYFACRLGPDGIRVNAVAPALVDRDVGRKLSDDPDMAKVIRATVPLGRAGAAADIGEAVAFLCSSAASYITGQVLVVDGGLGAREVFGAGLSASR
jgi:3-oxoacyl-[acyl-carrier protein] reductase